MRGKAVIINFRLPSRNYSDLNLIFSQDISTSTVIRVRARENASDTWSHAWLIPTETRNGNV